MINFFHNLILNVNIRYSKQQTSHNFKILMFIFCSHADNLFFLIELHCALLIKNRQLNRLSDLQWCKANHQANKANICVLFLWIFKLTSNCIENGIGNEIETLLLNCESGSLSCNLWRIQGEQNYQGIKVKRQRFQDLNKYQRQLRVFDLP